jgi:transposase-like protein
MAASSERREQWQELIEEYSTSGETVAGYCRFNNISVASFYYWKKRLSDAGQRKSGAQRKSGIQWLKVDAQPQAASALTLMVGAISVQVQPGFDPALLDDVLTVLVGLGGTLPQGRLERR